MKSISPRRADTRALAWVAPTASRVEIAASKCARCLVGENGAGHRHLAGALVRGPSARERLLGQLERQLEVVLCRLGGGERGGALAALTSRSLALAFTSSASGAPGASWYASR